jgi:NADP-dependent 3-hydroxy acid dehydrogenase YdfG
MPQPVAIIAGASSGIGEAAAKELARNGYRVVLAARRQDRLSELDPALSGKNPPNLWPDRRDR